MNVPDQARVKKGSSWQRCEGDNQSQQRALVQTTIIKCQMVSLRIGRNHSPLSAGIAAVVQLLSSLESNLSLNRCHRSSTVSTKRHRSPTLSSLVVRFL